MDIKKAPNINHFWGSLIIEELIRLGCDYFCLSPGSRSSPLVVPIAQNSKAKSFIHYDERGTAFHALGYTAATLKPSVIVSTSGTAVANFFPAVVEASKKKLPLIVLTADRPPELRKTGGDQTIDQPGIFGEYVRWQFDLPCPALDIKPEFILTTIDQAVYRTKRSPSGPVHLNCMFREPLAPVGTEENFQNYLKSLSVWLKNQEPFTRYLAPEMKPQTAAIKDLWGILSQMRHGVIAVGKLHQEKDRQAVVKLAQKLKWPIFADITSGLRLGKSAEGIIAHYDLILISEKFQEKTKVDAVLHLGGKVHSKRWHQFVAEKNPQHHIVVVNHPLRNDSAHNVTQRFECGVEVFCTKFLHGFSSSSGNPDLKKYETLSHRVDESIMRLLQASESLSEPAVARLISENIPKGNGLFLASSMPIRDMDMFASDKGHSVVVGANRGASGIDGTIATAAGFAKGLNRLTTLLIGDLAFLHDLNSLVMLRSLPHPIIVVVINNDGGAIFSFLPIAQFKEGFEKYFATPHGIRFESAAKLFELDYANPLTQTQFIKEYKKALKSKGSTIIEVITNRNENVAEHRCWQEAIRKTVERY